MSSLHGDIGGRNRTTASPPPPQDQEPTPSGVPRGGTTSCGAVGGAGGGSSESLAATDFAPVPPANEAALRAPRVLGVVVTGQANTTTRPCRLAVGTAEVGVVGATAPSVPTGESCKSAPAPAPSASSFSFLRRNNSSANHPGGGKSTTPGSSRGQRRSRSVGDRTELSAATDAREQQERPASRCSLPPDAALLIGGVLVSCSSEQQAHAVGSGRDDVSSAPSVESGGSKKVRGIGRRRRGESQNRDDGDDVLADDGGAPLGGPADETTSTESISSRAVGRKRELVKSIIRRRRANRRSGSITSDVVGAAPPEKSGESLSVAESLSSDTDSPKVVEDPAPPDEMVPPELLVIPSQEAIPPVPNTSTMTSDANAAANNNNPIISILHHSFIESCLPTCGDYGGEIVLSPTERTHDEEARLEHRLEDVEDPTVQESIECVFAHQLEDGLEGFFGDEDEVEIDDGSCREELSDSRGAEGGRRLPSPNSSTNNFRFLDSQIARSRTSSIGSASTISARDEDVRSRRTQRNRSAVASVLGVPHPLVHSASSDAELVAAARRTASDPDGLGLPPRPLSTTASASRSKAMSAGLPPKHTMRRGTTTGSMRRFGFDGEDDHPAHELRRRTWSRGALDSKRLVFIGTIGREGSSLADAAIGDEFEQLSKDANIHTSSAPNCSSCRGETTSIPHAPPHLWPQAPLLLRPTPGSGTKIRGIRYSGSDQYIWTPTSSGHNHTEGGTMACWSNYLQSSWHGGQPPPDRPAACAECAPIPVNNGNEAMGESLVVDFESDLFIGSLLLRIRNSQGTTPAPYDDSFGYFSGLNRRYQTVVRGMFKKDGIAMTDCVTGQVLGRKCGKLPPKMVLRGAVKIISYFAPQLKVKLDADKPYCISPLGSTPQVLQLKGTKGFDAGYQADQSIESSQEEPEDLTSSLLSLMGCQQSSAPTSVARAKARKKAFDRLYAENDKSLVFDRSTEYSFEFLQHLIDFEDLSVDLGSIAGKLLLKELLDGQPLKFMAAQRRNNNGVGGQGNKGRDLDLDYLWSFDIFHETLFTDCRDE